jgi:signal transduction histidine kinase
VPGAPMRSLRGALTGLGVLGFSFALLSTVLILSSDHVDHDLQMVFLVGHALFIEVGLVTWYRRPDNRFGSYMVVAGFVGMAASLGASDVSEIFTIGGVVAEFIPSFAALMLLSYPSGRLERPQRWVLGLFVLGSAGLGVPTLFFDDGPFHFKSGITPENALLITSNEAAVDLLNLLQGIVVAAATIAVIMLFSKGWREAGEFQRKALQPVLLTATLIAVLYGVQVSAQAAGASRDVILALEWTLLVYAAFPIAFVVGLVRGRMFGSGAVGSLITELGQAPATGNLRDRLAFALGDPTLELAYWLPREAKFVDSAGREIELPQPGCGRDWTPVERDGTPVAAIIHDSVLTATSLDMVRAAAGAAALALENDRLDAELRAKVAELAASRARIIAAGDAERRRLERDLHDGAQQRLVGLALKLRLAHSRLAHDPAGGAALVEESLTDLDAALAELRELARGIHPAVLTQRGLSSALSTLAGRAPIPVDLRADLAEGLSKEVEAAAYFVAAEALTNVAKYANATHAEVTVGRENGHAVVEVVDDGVGGAVLAPGSGLSGLRDRVSALDGTLVVESPPGGGTRVRAEIPCAS